jgi:hypothetical protein
MVRLATIGLVVGLCATAVGQGRVSMGRPSGGTIAIGMGGRHFGPGVVRSERGFNRRFRQNPYPYFPYYYGYSDPYFYSEDYGPYEPDYRPEPPPQPTQIVQEKAEPLPDPVLLELHGSQWVKVGNFGEASQQALNSPALTAPAKELPPAVLVYRDGHNEEISSYSIIGKVMYTKSDYYSSGSWTRTIQLADLDLPATLKQNQQRGVKFDLPSGPDEVVIRP